MVHKIVKIQTIYCHHFSGSKLHNKMVLGVFTMGQKMAEIKTNYCHHFSGSKLPRKMLLAVFTQYLVTKTQVFSHFSAKPKFLPMVVGCVQHYSTHFINKLGKSLESFFLKVKKKCKKWQKMLNLAKSAIFRKNAAL